MTNTASDVNNMVLRLRYGRFSLLPAGDAQEEGEGLLLLSGHHLDSLVWKVPHDGGADSSTPALLEAVNPELAVITVGVANRFGHPDKVTLAKLDGVSTYRNDQQSSVEVVTEGERCWLQTERRYLQAGTRHSRAPHCYPLTRSRCEEERGYC